MGSTLDCFGRDKDGRTKRDKEWNISYNGNNAWTGIKGAIRI